MATVDQTSIRGLGTARACFVAGLSLTKNGHRTSFRPQGAPESYLSCPPDPRPNNPENGFSYPAIRVSCPIAQIKPASSLAMAAVTTVGFLPRACICR